MPGLDKNLAVESEGICCGAGFFPIQQPRLPEIILQSKLIPNQITTLLKVDAFVTGNQQELLQVMMMNSCTENLAQAEEYLRLWLTRPGYEYITDRYTKNGVQI